MKHTVTTFHLVSTNTPNDPSVLELIRKNIENTLGQGDEILDVYFANDAQINIFWMSIPEKDRKMLYEKFGCVWMRSFRAPGYCNTLRLSDGHEWSACIKRNDYPAVIISQKSEEYETHE